MIDNYDSFTYNLVQYFLELGETVEVWRHDEIDIQGIIERQPQSICISPGPGNPSQAGISLAAIEYFMPRLPLLGVCLGHQAIGQNLGASIIQAKKIMHGKVSQIKHDATGIFKDVPQDLTVTRYHSLAIDEATLPDVLDVVARTDDGEIMAVAHKNYPCYGVQFHPEAILTECGHQMLGNFLKLAGEVNLNKNINLNNIGSKS